MTPEISNHDNFSLHVYCERGQPHHRPHCHLRRSDGSAETVVAIASLEVIVGPALSRQERAALREMQPELIEAWEERNDSAS
jgi:hypothetical protein